MLNVYIFFSLSKLILSSEFSGEGFCSAVFIAPALNYPEITHIFFSKICQKELSWLLVILMLCVCVLVCVLVCELLKLRQVLLGKTKSSPTLPVKASTISHFGQDGNHQLFHY